MNKLIGMVLFLLLAGCASQEQSPVNYYFLDNETSFITGDTLHRDPSLPLLVVGDVVLPPLLTQPNLLVQLDDGDMHYALQHVWAEPLSSAIPNVIVKRLRQLNSDYRFELGTEGWFGREQYRLMIEVTSFYPNQEQDVLLEGQYALVTPTGEPLMQQPFSFRQQAKNEQHAQAVTTMATLLRRLTDQINQTIIDLD